MIYRDIDWYEKCYCDNMLYQPTATYIQITINTLQVLLLEWKPRDNDDTNHQQYKNIVFAPLVVCLPISFTSRCQALVYLRSNSS